MSSKESESELHTGGCLCGAVRYEVLGPLKPVVACHCSQCRKTSGHFWASTLVQKANFKLSEDKGLRWFSSSSFAQRAFCSDCGSSVFYRRNDREDKIAVAAGTLDGPSGTHMEKHIFLDDAGDYYDIPSTD